MQGWVRLVRACGSKQLNGEMVNGKLKGQARKSLWIETISPQTASIVSCRVRLVRACGSKHVH